MSGSGSACFALLPAGADAAAITTAVRSAWGPSTLAIETCLM
jgi:4-diphosphocytidyl-2C-methyl-D-erythritol kinase